MTKGKSAAAKVMSMGKTAAASAATTVARVSLHAAAHPVTTVASAALLAVTAKALLRASPHLPTTVVVIAAASAAATVLPHVNTAHAQPMLASPRAALAASLRSRPMTPASVPHAQPADLQR